MPVVASSDFTLSTFRILAGLGEGGMARVFLAVSKKQAGFEKLLVLKVMRHDLGNDPEFHSMFMQEAQIAARLNHPNVVQTYEVGEDSGRVFIAMEYLEGQAFSQVIKQVGRGNLPLDLGVRILSDALLGLHYAHELTSFDGSPLGLVHRDISPHNLFILYTGDTKLVDFGIAKVAGATSHTRTGVIKGKVGYMAPEQIDGKHVDRRADLFSVSVILWELITKQRLVKLGDEEMAVFNRRITGRDPSVRTLADASIPEELVAILEQEPGRGPKARCKAARQAFRERTRQGSQTH
jgi:eukaryotic-like serine/threonine-protein kinase